MIGAGMLDKINDNLHKNLKISLDMLTLNSLKSWERCTNDTIIQISGKQCNFANKQNKLENN